MNDWQRICIPKHANIKEAIAAIDVGGIGLALVIDDNQRLLGTVTDGDVRRGLLRECQLQDSVSTVMNGNPSVATVGETSSTILSMMQRLKLSQIPIVDKNGYLVDIETLGGQIQAIHQDNPVVIMAGGFGKRLAPLTNNTPKPMLKIASKPMLEILLEQLVNAGFRQFYFAIHFQSEKIKQHFEDGAKWGANIEYIKEQEPLGTAGALSLLPMQEIKHPVLVMNADIMTQINFHHLHQFHSQQHAKATMCVREYQQSIPYGVVELDQHKLKALKEKPKESYFVNAGIYLLDPSVLSMIPKDTMYDMPTLLTELVDKDQTVAVFPIREYWMDIGHMQNFEQAQLDYEEFFNVSEA